MTSRAGRRPRLESALSLLRRLQGARGQTPPWDDGAPIRSELFSAERLEEHARSLAAAQVVTPGQVKGALLARRLADNEAVLLAAYRDVAEAIGEGEAITPVAEWLIDNFHLVEKQIREIRADLPPGYYRQLPKLAGGPFAGYPAHDPRALRPGFRPFKSRTAIPASTFFKDMVTRQDPHRSEMRSRLGAISKRYDRNSWENKSSRTLIWSAGCILLDRQIYGTRRSAVPGNSSQVQ